MAEEIEAKWLDINPEEVEKKLIDLGAKKEFDTNYRIRVFDYPDLRLNSDHSWLRLRDEGDKVTLTFKKRLGVKADGSNDDGMKEHEVVVSDFEETAEILLLVGLVQKYYEEKRRIRYRYQDIEYDIDFYPGLDPYLEIETVSWKRVDEGAKLLGLNSDEKVILTNSQLFKKKGIDMLDYSEFRFSGLVKREQKLDNRSE